MNVQGVASRQWSTTTLEDGLTCLRKNPPAQLLAASDMDPRKQDEQKLEVQPRS